MDVLSQAKKNLSNLSNIDDQFQFGDTAFTFTQKHSAYSLTIPRSGPSLAEYNCKCCLLPAVLHLVIPFDLHTPRD